MKMFHYKFDWDQKENLSCLSKSWNIFHSKRTTAGYVAEPGSHLLVQKHIIKLAFRYEHVSSENN